MRDIEEIREAISVFDWDGTCRRGFTIIDWMEFLSTEINISPSLERLDREFQRYRNHEVNHDQLSQLTAELYLASLKGLDIELIDELADEFVSNDRANLIFNLYVMKDRIKMPIHIVSGAPYEILKAYSLKYNLIIEGSLKIKRSQNRFGAGIEENSGTSLAKHNILNKLKSKNIVKFGFGNSMSDLPILNIAEQAFYFGEEELGDSIINVTIKNFEEQFLNRANL